MSMEKNGFWVVTENGSSWLPTRNAARVEQRDHGGTIYTEDQYNRMVAQLIERQKNGRTE